MTTSSLWCKLNLYVHWKIQTCEKLVESYVLRVWHSRNILPVRPCWVNLYPTQAILDQNTDMSANTDDGLLRDSNYPCYIFILRYRQSAKYGNNMGSPGLNLFGLPLSTSDISKPLWAQARVNSSQGNMRNCLHLKTETSFHSLICNPWTSPCYFRILRHANAMFCICE